MSEARFTKGPWEATERHGYHEILGPRQRSTWFGRQEIWAVAYVDTDLDEEAQRANAHLIAAAPRLYGALENLIARTRETLADGCSAEDHDAAIAEAEAALSDARGVQP